MMDIVELLGPLMVLGTVLPFSSLYSLNVAVYVDADMAFAS